MNTTIIIIAGIIGFIFIGITLLITNGQSKKKKQALHSLIKDRNQTVYDQNQGDETSDTKTNKKSGQGSLKQKLKSATGDAQNEELSLKSIKYLWIQAGLETFHMRFWVWSCVSCVLFFAIAKMFALSPLVTILWLITGFFGFPRYVLKKKVRKRQDKFLEEFADCLEGMIRLLKSGMPISEAIAMTSREYTGPIGQEMTKVYEAQRIGDTLPEAVAKMAFRVPMAEVKMFSTAITIQTQTGASLSDILQNLSNVIRQRFRLKRKVQALSAEAKISAGIIGCLPLVVIGAMYLLNHSYISLLWTTETGKMMMYGAIGWMGLGVLMMKGMINFKV
jgi:tight adherence protein B